MSVKRRLALYSGQRVDIPHIRALESAVSFDFDSVLRGMFTGLNKPYVIRGFDMVIPSASISADTLVMQVADSAVLHSSAAESGTILTVPAGQADEVLNAENSRVFGAFQVNSINYVSLEYRRITDVTTVDQTAGWSPSQDLEFQRAAPIGKILDYRFVISTSGFGTNLPLYVVKTNAFGIVEYITKGVSSLFRLGTGGANPNASNSFLWGNYNNIQTANPRREWVNDNTSLPNSLSVKPGADSNAFMFGDFSITTMKEWMDAVMTRFKELGNSEYWYTSSRLSDVDPSIFNTYFDSIGSVLTGAGDISYNLILESAANTSGRFKSLLTDNSLDRGDIYVEGVTSGTKASVTSYQDGQLLITSPTKTAFQYDEALRFRQVYVPSLFFKATDYNNGSTRVAASQRQLITASGPIASVSSFSFVNELGHALAGSKVTVDTSAAHGFTAGKFVRFSGMSLGIGGTIDGVYRVHEVPSTTQLIVFTDRPLTGTPVASGSIQLENQTRLPLHQSFSVTNMDLNSGTMVQLDIAEHNFIGKQSLSATGTNGTNTLTVPTGEVKVGMLVSGAGIPAGTTVTQVVGTTVTLSANLTAGVASARTFAERILITGLVSTSFAAGVLDRVYSIESLTVDNKVVIDIGAAYADGSIAQTATAEYIVYPTLLTINNANQTAYQLTNTTARSFFGQSLRFVVGDDSLPPLGDIQGSYSFDMVVAMSTVNNPVMVSTISNDGSGNLTVVTYTPHGLVTNSPIPFTIYGDQQLSEFIRSYTLIGIFVVDSTTFIIQNTGILNSNTYTNSGTDKVFSKYADNPYAGPIQWSDDIVIKAVMGELSFVVPQTATVDVNSKTLNANDYNTNGQTGTAYLEDGDVLYVQLERNKSAGSGATYSSVNGTITTSSIITDINGDPLVAGDWLKFSDEAENRWLRIRSINAFTVVLEKDNKQTPTSGASNTERPDKTGTLVYSKGSYDTLKVRKHIDVDLSSDVYWLAVRRDNSGSKSKVYFRALEIEAGEVRSVSDNQTNNMLLYTGAPNEGAINPNYSVISSEESYSFESDVMIEAVDVATNMVTVSVSPPRGAQKGDKIVYFNGVDYLYYTIKNTITSRTYIVNGDTSTLPALVTAKLQKVNQFITDQDNLTLALRKEDRQAGEVNTALQRPVYDESVYIQRINISGTGTIRSGSYVYKGSLTNPTALAWVLHGNATVTETIESSLVTMPGGHASIGSSAVLVHIYFGTFSDGDGLNQNGISTGRTVNNPSNPPFDSPQVIGDPITGVEIVLPANRRTEVKGTEYVTFGNHSFYKQSAEPSLSGEDLWVIVNDGIREANIDYSETFGGPKGKIRIVRTMPPNTRMRFRVMTSFGSVLAARSSDVTLQAAYNAGNTIVESPARPVELTSSNPDIGETALVSRGSILINGGTNYLGGLFGEGGDQAFVIGREDNKPRESWTALAVVKSHNSHPDSGFKTKTAAQVVTGDTPTIIADSFVNLDDNKAYRIKISGVARRSDGTLGSATFNIEGGFYKTAGIVYAAGSPVSEITGSAGDGLNYALVFGISGSTVVGVVYGSAGATLQWALTIEFQAVGIT